MDSAEDNCIENEYEEDNFCDKSNGGDNNIDSYPKKVDLNFRSSFISFFVCLLNSTKDRRAVVRGHPPDSNGNRNTKLT